MDYLFLEFGTCLKIPKDFPSLACSEGTMADRKHGKKLRV
jgi:hypothetical protein